MQESIIHFYDKFLETNKLIFSKLKDTVNNEENTLLSSLDDLKRNIKVYIEEEKMIENNQNSFTRYPHSDIKLRKNENNFNKN